MSKTVDYDKVALKGLLSQFKTTRRAIKRFYKKVDDEAWTDYDSPYSGATEILRLVDDAGNLKVIPSSTVERIRESIINGEDDRRRLLNSLSTFEQHIEDAIESLEKSK